MGNADSLTAQGFLNKAMAIFGNLASIAGFGLYILEHGRQSTVSVGGLNTILHLTVLTTLACGFLWKVLEWVFGWKFGTGRTDAVPSGFSAIIMSFTWTLPLAVVPWFYQFLTGTSVVTPMHWRGSLLLLIGGICTFLLAFGTSTQSPNGFRQRLMPYKKKVTISRGLAQEALFTSCLILLMVVPYRLASGTAAPFWILIIGGILLPWLV